MRYIQCYLVQIFAYFPRQNVCHDMQVVGEVTASFILEARNVWHFKFYPKQFSCTYSILAYLFTAMFCDDTITSCCGWLGGVTVRASDSRSCGRGFDSRSGRYQATQPSIPPSTGHGWLGLMRGAFTCVGWQVTLCDPVWQVTSRSWDGFPMKRYTQL